MTVRQPTSLLWFVGPLLAVYGAALWVVEVLPRVETPGAVAMGLTLDLVVLVPLLFYVVLVRGRGWPAIALAPVVLLSFGAASFLIPAEHQTLLDALGYALPVIELALVGYVGYKAWRVIRAKQAANIAGGDFYDRVRETLRGVLDVPAAASALAYEISIFHYAFATRRPEASPHRFSYDRRSGYGAVFAAILMAATVELVALHFLLHAWSETAALIHAVVSVYGILWLVGDYRAMRSRPHELEAEGLRLRYGIRWDLTVPWSDIAAIRRTRQPAPGDDYLNLVPVGSPRYVVDLRAPVEAVGPYGITRAVRRIGLIVDRPEAFEAQLQDRGLHVEP